MIYINNTVIYGAFLFWKVYIAKAHQRYKSEGLATYWVKAVLIQQYYYHLAINHLRVGNWKFDTRIANSDNGIQIDRNSPGHHSASSLIMSLTCSLNYMKAISIGLIINLYPYLKSAHTDHAPTFCTCCRAHFSFNLASTLSFITPLSHSRSVVEWKEETFEFDFGWCKKDLLAKTMSAWTVFSKVYRNGMLAMSFEEPNFKRLRVLPWFANYSHEFTRSVDSWIWGKSSRAVQQCWTL